MPELLDLPDELLIHISSFLWPYDVARARRVCYRMLRTFVISERDQRRIKRHLQQQEHGIPALLKSHLLSEQERLEIYAGFGPDGIYWLGSVSELGVRALMKKTGFDAYQNRHMLLGMIMNHEFYWGMLELKPEELNYVFTCCVKGIGNIQDRPLLLRQIRADKAILLSDSELLSLMTIR